LIPHYTVNVLRILDRGNTNNENMCLAKTNRRGSGKRATASGTGLCYSPVAREPCQ